MADHVGSIEVRKDVAASKKGAYSFCATIAERKKGYDPFSVRRHRRGEELIMMSRKGIRWPSVVIVLGLAAIAVGRLSGQGAGQPSSKNGEWPAYTADIRGTRYSPLDQINAANFKQLEVAWRFKTDNLGPRPEFKLEGTPLMVKGVYQAP